MLLCTTGRIFHGCPSACRYGRLDCLYTFKTCPLDDPPELGRKKKSQGAISGEQEGCSSTVMSFPARNCRMPRVLWAGALTWRNNDYFSRHKSCLFSRTQRSKRRSISLWTCWLIVWPCGKNTLKTMPLTSKNGYVLLIFRQTSYDRASEEDQEMLSTLWTSVIYC